MAKQNFLAGGYYGKLGQTVGQRWKNIRTIRTYVIPKNPRTEAQQANRKTFGTYVEAAQWGNAANYRASVWASDAKTEWSLRMAQAAALEKAGMTGLDKVPLFPVGFVPPLSITEISLRDEEVLPVMSFTISGDVPDTERLFSMLLDRYDSAGAFQDRHVLIAYTTAENPGVLYAENPELIDFTEDVRVRIVSIDGTDPATDMICSNEISVGAAPKPAADFDFTVTKAYIKNNLLYITVNQDYVEGTAKTQDFTVDLPSEIIGRIYTGEAAQITNDSGKFQFVFGNGLFSDTDHPYIGDGAKITANSFVWEGADYIYSCSSVEQALPYTAVTLTSYSAAIVHDKLYMQFKESLDADENNAALVEAEYSDSGEGDMVSGGLSSLSELGGKLMCVFDGIPDTEDNFGHLGDYDRLTVKFIAYRKGEASYVASATSLEYYWIAPELYYAGKDLTGTSPYVAVGTDGLSDVDVKTVGVLNFNDFGKRLSVAEARATMSVSSGIMKFDLTGKLPTAAHGLFCGNKTSIQMSYFGGIGDTVLYYSTGIAVAPDRDTAATITPEWASRASSGYQVYLYLQSGPYMDSFTAQTGTGAYQTNRNGVAASRANESDAKSYSLAFQSGAYWFVYAVANSNAATLYAAKLHCKATVPEFTCTSDGITYTVSSAEVTYSNNSDYVGQLIFNKAKSEVGQYEEEGHYVGYFIPAFTWQSESTAKATVQMWDGDTWGTEDLMDTFELSAGDVTAEEVSLYVEEDYSDIVTFALNGSFKKQPNEKLYYAAVTEITYLTGNLPVNMKIVASGLTFYAYTGDINYAA